MSKHRRHHHSNSGANKTRQQVQTYQRSHYDLAAESQIQPKHFTGNLATDVQNHFSGKPSFAMPNLFPLKKGGKAAKVAEQAQPEVTVEDAGKKYIVDTNVLISCPNIIADEDDESWREVIDADPKLDNATIIIPQVVFDELDNMKSEVSHRGTVARMIFRRLSKIIPNTKRSLGEIAAMENPVPLGWKNQSVCVLPLPKDFYRILPWVPDRDDNDGWIAVTALYATLLMEGININALIAKKKDAPKDEANKELFNIMEWRTKKKDESSVFLLTNDHGLMIKANNYGVRTKHFRFKKPRVINGIRDMTVPREFYELAVDNSKEGLDAGYFEQFFPEEPPLTANEYIIMRLDEEIIPNWYLIDSAEFKNIFRYNKKDNRLHPISVGKGQKPINAGIAAYYDAMNDERIKVINVTGMAGTGKTYQAITHAMKAIRNGEFVRAILIPAKSASNPLGALPGNKEQKMEPLVAIAKAAIRSYLSETQTFKDWRARLRKFSEEPQISEEDTNGEKYGKSKKKGRRDYYSDYDSAHTTGSSPGTFDDLDGFRFANIPVKNGDGSGHSKKREKESKAYYPSKSDKAQTNEHKLTYAEALEKQVDLTYKNYFTCIPLEEVQGCTFDHSIIIIDEAQRIKTDTADTLLPRAGKDSKLFVLGDISQIQDSNREKQFNNALYYSRELFFDSEICANIQLTENLRSDIADVMTQNRNVVRMRMGLI